MQFDKKTVFFVVIAFGVLYLFSLLVIENCEEYAEAKANYESREQIADFKTQAEEKKFAAFKQRVLNAEEQADKRILEAQEAARKKGEEAEAAAKKKGEKAEAAAKKKGEDAEEAANKRTEEKEALIKTLLEEVEGKTELANERALASSQVTKEYLDLLRNTITGTAYASIENAVVPGVGNYDTLGKQAYNANSRRLGADWPSIGFSMVGTVRMDGLRTALDTVTNNDVEGDFVECGVWRGGASIFAAGYFDIKGLKNREIWVVDSFDGLPPARTGHDMSVWSKMDYLKVSQPTVQMNFESIGVFDPQRIHFVKGYFVHSLPGIQVKKIAVLRMDGDMYESTMDQLFNLYERVSIGGWLLVDDYGVIEDCKKAIHDFREWHGIDDPIIALEDKSVYWVKGKQVTVQMERYWPLVPTTPPA